MRGTGGLSDGPLKGMKNRAYKSNETSNQELSTLSRIVMVKDKIQRSIQEMRP